MTLSERTIRTIAIACQETSATGREHWVNLISEWMPDERREIRARIKAWGAIHGDHVYNTKRLQANHSFIIDIIHLATNRAGVAMPISALQRTSDNPRYREDINFLATFLAEQNQQRRVQEGILLTGMECLIAYLQEELNIPLTPRTLVQHLHEIPALLDRAFPGYARAGMLPITLRPPVPAEDGEE